MGCPERLWSLPPWRYSRVIRTWSWAAGCSWPCLSMEGLDQKTSRGPFTPQPFCNSEVTTVTCRALSYHRHEKLAPGLKAVQSACCFTPAAVLVKKRSRVLVKG
ncbi:hypothetical protein QYF61_023760 [Mycteria americana]|uniref:Uncharacterized protein n=1 Tax=Mycteria americana TaxID=33587 RepID=A0AAN7RZV8_MYCAM|nr:hypothetical protein QYF61_023760 [Mycteria americana]